MEKENNRVIGNLAWVVLLVVMIFFVVYGIFFTPRAYGESIVIGKEQSFVV